METEEELCFDTILDKWLETVPALKSISKCVKENSCEINTEQSLLDCEPFKDILKYFEPKKNYCFHNSIHVALESYYVNYVEGLIRINGKKKSMVTNHGWNEIDGSCIDITPIDDTDFGHITSIDYLQILIMKDKGKLLSLKHAQRVVGNVFPYFMGVSSSEPQLEMLDWAQVRHTNI